jgi:hypothetical protein
LKKQLDIVVQVIDAGGGDRRPALSLGQYESTLENGLRVQRETLGRPFRAYPVKSHRFCDVGFDFRGMAADAGVTGSADRRV